MLDRKVYTRSSLSTVLYHIFDGLSFLEKYAIGCQPPLICGSRAIPPLHAASAAMESGGLKAEIAMKRLLLSR